MNRERPWSLGIAAIFVGCALVPFIAGCTSGGECGGAANCAPASPPCPFLDGGAFEPFSTALACNPPADFDCTGRAPVVCAGGQLASGPAATLICTCTMQTPADAGPSAAWECMTYGSASCTGH